MFFWWSNNWSTLFAFSTAFLASKKVFSLCGLLSATSATCSRKVSITSPLFILGLEDAEDFDETSFTDASLNKGDIVFTAMKGPGSAQYFNGTFEVEF